MGVLLSWLIALLVLVGFGGAALWGRQQTVRANEAERQLATQVQQTTALSLTLTAVVQAQATAQATAAARSNEPSIALERALGLVFAAYQEPTEGRLRAVNDAFSQTARSMVFQSEAEHLISSGRKLGGSSDWRILDAQVGEIRDDRVDVRTRELWIYDEVDAAGTRQRCLREESEQTYTLRRTAVGWLVEDVILGPSPSRRSEC
jgi:hypothetical protein